MTLPQQTEALGALRVQIDSLDQQLLTLLNERARVAEEVADIQGAPDSVVKAGEALATAAADGEAVGEGASDTAADADEVVADYNDATADLQDAVSEEKTAVPAEAASDEGAAVQDGAEAGTADAT